MTEAPPGRRAETGPTAGEGVPVATVELWFDYLSPYARFAWAQVPALCASRGVTLRPRPVLLAGLLQHWGQLGPAEIPPKRVWTFKDCWRWAKLHDLRFVPPRTHPFNPLTALRASLPEVAGDDQPRVIDALYRAGWEEGIDLGSPAEIAAALDRAGLDGAVLVERTREPAVKEALQRQTAEAIARGVFGVPTMICDDGELFWGNDRVAYLEMHLDGRDPLDGEDVAAMDRPAGATRTR